MMSRVAVVALMLALAAPAFAFEAKVDFGSSGVLPSGHVTFDQYNLHGKTNIYVDLMNVEGLTDLAWQVVADCSNSAPYMQGEANGAIPVPISDGQKTYYDVAGLPVVGIDTIVGRYLHVSWTAVGTSDICLPIHPVVVEPTYSMENSAKAGFLVAFTIVVFCFGCLVAGILKVHHELKLVKEKIGYHEI